MTDTEIKSKVLSFVKEHENAKKILIIAPDFTRFHSNAGLICTVLYRSYKEKGAAVTILEALGTHVPMTEDQLNEMYPGIDKDVFVAHNWRKDVVTVGKVPGSFISDLTEGLWNEDIEVQINRLITDTSFDLIVSVGQVVPHEVIGMANHSKNIFVGTGGADMINKSHMVGAVYGMERMMGKDFTPVRKIFDYAAEHFLASMPLYYMLTVCTGGNGVINTHGLFIGKDRKILEDAISLSQKKNINFVEKGIKKCVVYLNPDEFKSTWLGNKAVYRTRMAIADGGSLLILAPGVERFGEDAVNDSLIRKYGYRGRLNTLEIFKTSTDLQENMGVAAHLIHGSSDGRFTVTYAVDKISCDEIRKAGYNAISYSEAVCKYNPVKLKDGFNIVDNEEVFFISNPALGLWIDKERFEHI